MLISSRESPPPRRVTSLPHSTVTRGWASSRSTRDDVGQFAVIGHQLPDAPTGIMHGLGDQLPSLDLDVGIDARDVDGADRLLVDPYPAEARRP
jgi:hypothetical protein